MDVAEVRALLQEWTDRLALLISEMDGLEQRCSELMRFTARHDVEQPPDVPGHERD